MKIPEVFFRNPGESKVFAERHTFSEWHEIFRLKDSIKDKECQLQAFVDFEKVIAEEYLHTYSDRLDDFQRETLHFMIHQIDANPQVLLVFYEHWIAFHKNPTKNDSDHFHAYYKSCAKIYNSIMQKQENI